MKRLAAVCAIALAACRFEIKDAPTISDPSADMSAENVVHFDLQPKAGAALQIASQNVGIELDFISLKFHFTRLDVTKEGHPLHEIIQPRYRVRLFARHTDGSLELVRESDPDFIDSRLVPRLYNVTSVCEKVCVVDVAVELSDDTKAESAPAELHLLSGTGVIASTKDGDDPCRWLAADEATAIVGKPMKYADAGSGDCTMQPETGRVPTFYYTLFEKPTLFNKRAMDADAEMLALGQRAVWIPRTATLWAVRGEHMLGLRMGPVGAPPAPTPAVKKTAEAIARKIIEKM